MCVRCGPKVNYMTPFLRVNIRVLEVGVWCHGAAPTTQHANEPGPGDVSSYGVTFILDPNLCVQFFRQLPDAVDLGPA